MRRFFFLLCLWAPAAADGLPGDWLQAWMNGLLSFAPPAARGASDYYDYLVRLASEAGDDYSYGSDNSVAQENCARVWGASCFAWYHGALGSVTPPAWLDGSGNGRTLRPVDADSATNVSRASGGASLREDARLAAGGKQPPLGLAWTTCALVREETPCENCTLWTFQGTSLFRVSSHIVLRAGEAETLVPFNAQDYAVCAAFNFATGELLLALNAGTYNMWTSLTSARYASSASSSLQLGPAHTTLTFLEVLQLSEFLDSGRLGAATSALRGRSSATPPPTSPSTPPPTFPSTPPATPPATPPTTTPTTPTATTPATPPATPPPTPTATPPTTPTATTPATTPATPPTAPTASPPGQEYTWDLSDYWKDYSDYWKTLEPFRPPPQRDASKDPAVSAPPATPPATPPLNQDYSDWWTQDFSDYWKRLGGTPPPPQHDASEDPAVSPPPYPSLLTSPPPLADELECAAIRAAAQLLAAVNDLPQANVIRGVAVSVSYHMAALLDELIFASAILGCPFENIS